MRRESHTAANAATASATTSTTRIRPTSAAAALLSACSGRVSTIAPPSSIGRASTSSVRAPIRTEVDTSVPAAARFAAAAVAASSLARFGAVEATTMPSASVTVSTEPSRPGGDPAEEPRRGQPRRLQRDQGGLRGELGALLGRRGGARELDRREAGRDRGGEHETEREGEDPGGQAAHQSGVRRVADAARGADRARVARASRAAARRARRPCDRRRSPPGPRRSTAAARG